MTDERIVDLISVVSPQRTDLLEWLAIIRAGLLWLGKSRVCSRTGSLSFGDLLIIDWGCRHALCGCCLYRVHGEELNFLSGRHV